MRWRWPAPAGSLARRCAGALAAISAGLTLAAASARAQLVDVALSAPASVTAHTPVLVRVEVTAPIAALVRLAPPAFSPFTLTRTDRTPTDTVVQGGRQRLEWQFVLRAPAPGTYAFEPFAVDVQGPGLRPATFRSRAWSMAVSTAVVSTPRPVAPPELTATDPERLTFDARLSPERVYVGEQTTLELRVGVGARVRERLRRSPEFAFPTVSGVVAYDLSSGHASTAAGDVHVYRRALFPLAAGRLDVPAAQLTYALSPADDPFGVEQQGATQTPLRHIVVVAPPLAGRPATWDGAVGRFRASARVDTAHARVGDAVTYTLRIEGTGNVLLLPRPPLTLPWADVASAAERVSVDSSGELAGGSKEFDWLLTPRAAGTVQVPAERYAYFDPQAAQYAFADAPLVVLRVAPGATSVAPVISAGAVPRSTAAPSGLGVLRHWDGELAPPPVVRRSFWILLASVPVPTALWLLGGAALTRRQRRRRVRSARSVSADPSSPRAVATAALGEFADGLSRLLDVPNVPVGDPRLVTRTLRRAGVGASLARESAAAVDAWAWMAYAFDRAEPDTAIPPPRALLARISSELEATARDARRPAPRASAQTPRPTLRRPRAAYAVRVLAVATLATATLAVAVAGPEFAGRAAGPAPRSDTARAVPAFDAGVMAYARGDAARAYDLFAVAAAAAPAAPAAWINAGTAAWSTGDTATAAFAWHRAARLAPGYPGLRARLDLLPVVAARGHVGAPPPVDARLLSGAALVVAAIAALWLLAVATSGARRADSLPRAPRTVFAWSGPLAAYVCAVVLAGGAALAAQAMNPAGLAVVRTAALLRPEPAAPAIGPTSTATGELAEVLASEPGWTRIRLDEAREGWIRASEIAPLDGAP